MPQAGAIRAGRAFVELFADDSKLVRGLKRAQAKLKAFGESVRNMGLKLAGLGSAIVAPLGNEADAELYETAIAGSANSKRPSSPSPRSPNTGVRVGVVCGRCPPGPPARWPSWPRKTTPHCS